MSRSVRSIATAVGLAFMLAAPRMSANAQIDSSSQWRFNVTPYGWLAGVKGTVGVGPVDTKLDVSVGDALKALNFAAMASGEVRRGAWLFAADAVYLSVGGEKTLAIRGDTGSLELTQHETLLQPMAGYAIRRSTYSVDLLAGLRYWNLSTTLDVERPRASNERSASRQWVDALGGVRLRGVGPGHLRYLVGTDAGGGGSRGTWQAYGVAGYDVSSLITVDLGYRYLDVDYDHDRFLFDVRTHGTIVGVTFRF